MDDEDTKIFIELVKVFAKNTSSDFSPDVFVIVGIDTKKDRCEHTVAYPCDAYNREILSRAVAVTLAQIANHTIENGLAPITGLLNKERAN